MVLIERRGKPGMIVSDHGTEFTSNAILAGSRNLRSSGTISRQESRCTTVTLNPSTGRMRDEFLNESLFFGLDLPAAPSRNGPKITIIPAAFIARISDPGRLCRDHRGNRLQRCAR